MKGIGQMSSNLALSYYHLENHLFQVVRLRFLEDHSLGAADFFCIIIWKANRAKSYVAKRLFLKDPQKRTELESIVRDLTSAIHSAKDGKGRLCLLRKEWGFGLPIATAILTVLYPDEFTVYDVRVCQQLDRFRHLDGIEDFEKLWECYLEFLNAVCEAAPTELCIRDKDRYLWGKSFAESLACDIENGFGVRTDGSAPVSQHNENPLTR